MNNVIMSKRMTGSNLILTLKKVSHKYVVEFKEGLRIRHKIFFDLESAEDFYNQGLKMIKDFPNDFDKISIDLFGGNHDMIMTYKFGKGTAYITNDYKIVVRKGSIINKKLCRCCPDSAKKRINKEYRAGNIKDGVTTKDLTFNTLSGAACFISGCTINGFKSWITCSGLPIGDLIL